MSASRLARCPHRTAIARADAGGARARHHRVAARARHDDVAEVEVRGADLAVVDRRRALALAAGLALLDPSPALASSALLSERLERKDLSKPVFNKARPGPQRYPDWLEGTWRCTATFAGFEFPSKTMSKSALIKEPTIPGFQKLSLVYVPDVGTSDVSYDVRFAKFEGIEGVLEDRAFNLKSIVNAYLGKDAVEAVEYEPTRDANRTTVNIRPGASPNAERIELFCNARESETRASDRTFFAAEASRQVTLGYGKDFGTARVVNTDYQHVWTFTPTNGDETTDAVSEARVTLSTAGYVQANDALRFTAAPNASSGAPMPSLGGAAGAAFEPAVLYSHVMTLRRL